jgi:hypothetical protein
VERWLALTRQRFHGNEPIPRLGSRQATAPPASVTSSNRLAAIRMDLDAIDKVANG